MPSRRGVRALAAALTGAALLACGGEPTPDPVNVVLITVDTLRADRLGAYGYEAARTPHIDALAAESIRFDRAYAHASATLPSVMSLLTGVLPARHGIVGNRGESDPDVPTLAQILERRGFVTAAFVGNWVLRPGRGPERGFAVYTKDFRAREAVRGHPENPAERLTDQAVAWLRQRDPLRPFLLWVHYQEPHGPYTPPRFDAADAGREGPVLPRSPTNSGRGAIPNYQWLGHGRVAEYLARYDGEVAEVDRQVGRLLDALRGADLLERSAVVFTSDHGEAFGEDELYLAHGDGLSEVLLRVPLLLRLPGGRGDLREDRVRLVDVVPTVLEVLDVPADGLPGESLLAATGDRTLTAQFEPLSHPERWRLVREDGFELEEEDPHGLVLRDLSTAQEVPAQEARAAHARLLRRLEELAPWTEAQRRPPVLDPEEREALESLGYVD